jgi:hypothetical protein
MKLTVFNFMIVPVELVNVWLGLGNIEVAKVGDVTRVDPEVVEGVGMVFCEVNEAVVEIDEDIVVVFKDVLDDTPVD